VLKAVTTENPYPKYLAEKDVEALTETANIHRSLDGTKVVNYVQWKKIQAFEDMLQNPEAQIHMNESLSVSQPEPHLYKVVSCL